MAFWSRKKEPESRSWKLPGEMGTVSLPESLAVEYENDETLLASFADDLVILRFSSISFRRDGVSDECVAKLYVRDKAKEEDQAYYEVGQLGISTYDEESAGDGTSLLIRYWNVGDKNTIVIVSATLELKMRDERRVLALWDQMPRIVESIAITKVHTTTEYDGEEVSIVRETAEAQDQKVVEFDEEYNAWLRGSLDAAASLAMKYGGGGVLTPEELDIVFGRWMSNDDEKESESLVANALGAAFGEFLVQEEGFRWVVVTDAYGTDVAVRHAVGQTMAFPVSSVAKRIEAKEPDCFQGLRIALLSLRKELGEASE